MTRGMNPSATRPLLGLVPQLVRGLVGQRMTLKFTSTEIVFTPPLNEIAATSAAYSLRRVRSAYTGPAIRVRRPLDNAEADIGFTSAGNLNTTALLAHCGVNSGFVTTWYDQSGNGRNLTQATSGAQPRIVNAGVVDTLGGVPALICDAVDDFMTATTWGTIAQPFSRNTVVRMAASLSGSTHVMNTATGAPNVADFTNNGTTLTAFAGSVGPSTTVSANERMVYTSIYDGASSVVAKNGILSATGDPGSSSTAGFSININGSNFGGFSYQEIVLFDARVSTTDRQTLERNQGAYYGITVA